MCACVCVRVCVCVHVCECVKPTQSVDRSCWYVYTTICLNSDDTMLELTMSASWEQKHLRANILDPMVCADVTRRSPVLCFVCLVLLMGVPKALLNSAQTQHNLRVLCVCACVRACVRVCAASVEICASAASESSLDKAFRTRQEGCVDASSCDCLLLAAFAL